MDKEYFCPIMYKCPHWLDKCYLNGCQHPEAIEMRNEMINKPWRPDWFSLGLWAVIAICTLTIYYNIVAPVVGYLR